LCSSAVSRPGDDRRIDRHLRDPAQIGSEWTKKKASGEEDQMTGTTDMLELVESWAAAEQGSDVEALDRLLAGDLVGVGPVGFVSGRDQWLARFGNGLENRGFAVEGTHMRDYGTAAVVVGTLAHSGW
jgi:Domain of unknown function (DUF4440)